jgi:hypothetical protein
MSHDHDVNPIRSITMSAFTKEVLQAVSQSVALLPQVTTAAGLVISKGASATVNGISAVDSLFAYGADYADDIRQDQLALLELKQSYRDIVKTDAAKAVTAGDKQSILDAYKAMQTAFESID